MEIKKEEDSLTYHEYLQANNNVIYEVIGNYIFNMSPSPSVKHQMISGELLTEFNNYLRQKTCKAIAEIAVSLEGVTDTTKMKEWVRPNISIVCDQDKMEENHIAGAPNLIVEILSKSTAKADKMIKFNMKRGWDIIFLIELNPNKTAD